MCSLAEPAKLIASQIHSVAYDDGSFLELYKTLMQHRDLPESQRQVGMIIGNYRVVLHWELPEGHDGPVMWKVTIDSLSAKVSSHDMFSLLNHLTVDSEYENQYGVEEQGHVQLSR